jgi:hypothetical protein
VGCGTAVTLYLPYPGAAAISSARPTRRVGAVAR